MLGRQSDDQVAMDRRPGTTEHNQAAVRPLRERGEGTLDLGGIAHVDGTHVHAEGRRQRLNYAEHARTNRDVGLTKDRSPRHTRRDLLEQLQPLSTDGVFEHGKAGGVAARPFQAFDVTGSHRVGHTCEHDRDGAARLRAGLLANFDTGDRQKAPEIAPLFNAFQRAGPRPENSYLYLLLT